MATNQLDASGARVAYDGREVDRWCPSCGFPLRGCLGLSCSYCEAYPEVRGTYPPPAFLRAFPNHELNAAIEAVWDARIQGGSDG